LEGTPFFLGNKGQNAVGLFTGLHNLETLPVGTHTVLEIEFNESKDLDPPFETVCELTVPGKEVVYGKDCTVANLTMNMEWEVSGISVAKAFWCKEWVETTGAPVRMIGNEIGKSQIVENLPSDEEWGFSGFYREKWVVSFTVDRVRSELYQGQECWVYEMTKKDLTETYIFPSRDEMKTVFYVDKENYAVVRTTYETHPLGEFDSGYMKPAISIRELEWELAHKEPIMTDMGTFECQVIFLKENGKTLGTIWANKEARIPLKYVYSYQEEDYEVEIRVILTRYTENSQTANQNVSHTYSRV